MSKKRHNKSKSELLAETKQREMREAQLKETERRRAVAKDVFYPLLLEDSQSIRHAQNLCKIMENAILTLHNNELALKSLGELNLAQHFGDDEDPAHVVFRKIVEAFKDEKLNACLEIIGGMSGAIDSFIAQETTQRPLSELKTHFL